MHMYKLVHPVIRSQCTYRINMTCKYDMWPTYNVLLDCLVKIAVALVTKGKVSMLVSGRPEQQLSGNTCYGYGRFENI